MPLKPEEKETFAQFRPMFLWFTGSAMAAFVLSLMPLPWPALGAAFAAVGAVLCLTGAIKARKLPACHGVARTFTLGFAFSVLLMGYFGLISTQWPAQMELQRCLSKALTEQSTDACLQGYQENAQMVLDRLTGPRD
ncbi:MAG: hypothetical protein LBH48_01865 [Bifidobacteriaceae bacterium]|jgi:hypothetical protein|nr:hypothetical protein [Bifidobacteriaceae bacterium]